MITFFYWWVVIGVFCGMFTIYNMVYECGWDYLYKENDSAYGFIPFELFKLLYACLSIVLCIIIAPIALICILIKISRKIG